MKKSRKWIVLIGTVMILAVAVIAVAVLQTPEKKEKRTGNITYRFQDAEFVECLENDFSHGVATQGMAASEKYIYSSKISKDEQYAIIYQYDPKNDTQRLMTYYPGLDAAEPGPVDCVLHCNDMTFYTDRDKTAYLMAATLYNPSNAKKPYPALTVMEADEKNATLRLAGYVNLLRKNSAGEDYYMTASSVRHVGQTKESNYFLIKAGNDFYVTKLPVGTAGGTKEAPLEVYCTLVFTAESRNAVFVDEAGEAYTMDNLETWVHQGCFYDSQEDLLYVPLYNAYNLPTMRYDNVIIVFDVDGRLTTEAMDALTEDQPDILHPTNLSFCMTHDKKRTFEMESCVFLKNQGKKGDHFLYFNADSTPVSDYEGIWRVNYQRGDVEIQPLVGEDSVVYSVEYHYNYGDLPKSEWPENSQIGSMKQNTLHVVGITTNLRVNRFTNKGVHFEGWQLFRHSDETWLYSDGNWYSEESAPTGLEKKVLKDAEPVDGLTTVNNDLITAYAQWQ